MRIRSDRDRIAASLTDPKGGHVNGQTQMTVAFNPAGKVLATVNNCGSRSTYLWDLATGHIAANLKDSIVLGDEINDVAAMAFSPNGNLLATADDNGNTYLWNVRSP
jgi:WD40 repeat protein